jgi:phosphatidylserine decarboxylase
MTELFIAFQRLLPSFWLGRLVHWASRVRTPWFKDLLINAFCRLYPVELEEAAEPDTRRYASFNAFFTRALRDGARPQDPDPKAILCPADGRVQQSGPIDRGQLLQAKGMLYGVDELLADPQAVQRYDGGQFLTVYLAPPDYHRVHIPLAGRLRSMHYAPGERWSVNQRTTGAIPRLFAVNERLCCHFETDSHYFAVVMVGALNVASISTVWAGEVLPTRPRETRHWQYGERSRIELDRGAEMGRFNLGSTVILLLPPGLGQLQSTLKPGDALKVGQRVGQLES